MSTCPSVFFVGLNTGSFGMEHTINQATLVKSTNTPSIAKIHSSNGHAIYTDKDHDRLWAAGCNEYGQCGTGNSQDNEKFTPITYFKQHQIIIKKVCMSLVAGCTFFLSDANRIYGCGKNMFGVETDEYDITVPTLVTQLSNVIDAASSLNRCIVLCSSANTVQIVMILSFWSRICRKDLPQELLELLVCFTKLFTVYSIEENSGWDEMKIFRMKNINIIKIASGCEHGLFLDEFGDVWADGDYTYIGMGDIGHNVYVPERISYFTINNIKIKDIVTGFHHSLAIDINSKVYSWGFNESGQCELGYAEDYVYKPKQIQELDDYVVDTVKCGYSNSSIKTECEKWYMFGCNRYGECLHSDAQQVLTPHRIDIFLKETYNIDEIIDISLGAYNTKIVCILQS